MILALTATGLTRFADAEDAAPVADDHSWRSALTWLIGPGRPLILLLVTMATINFALAFFNVAILALATSVGGPARAGLALGLGGLAMVAGSLIVGSRGVSDRRVRTVGRGLLLLALGAAVADRTDAAKSQRDEPTPRAVGVEARLGRSRPTA